jgi:hypothetical protein
VTAIGTRVVLELYEVAAALWVAEQRYHDCVRNRRRDILGFDNPEAHKIGALAEMAFAKWRGIYWDFSVGSFHDHPDVGRYSVRTKRLGASRGELIIRPSDVRDEPDVLYVLMVSGGTRFGHPVRDEWYVAGAITPREAARQCWWRTNDSRGYPDAWFVPQRDLWQPDEWPGLLQPAL